MHFKYVANLFSATLCQVAEILHSLVVLCADVVIQIQFISNESAMNYTRKDFINCLPFSSHQIFLAMSTFHSQSD